MIRKLLALTSLATIIGLTGCDAFGPVSQTEDFYLSIKSIKQFTLLIDFTDVKQLLTPTNAAALVVKNVTNTWGMSSGLVKINSVVDNNGSDKNFGLLVEIKNQPKITFDCSTKMQKKNASVLCAQR